MSEAVRRRLLSEDSMSVPANETLRINELADELNREAEDVLEYQALS